MKRTGLLSPRQIEVLQLAATGMTNYQIGAELGIGEQTIKGHLSSIFERLDVPDRTSAVVTAFGLGVMPLPVPVSIGSESWSAS